MIRDRWHRHFKYTIDTTFTTWVADLTDHTLNLFPHLWQEKEFELWFNLPNAKEPIHLTILPQEKRVLTKNY